MSRFWDGFNDSILVMNPGALATLGNGPYTFLVMLRRTSNNVGPARWRDGGVNTRYAFIDSGLFWTEGGVAGPAVTNAAWRIVGFSMPDVGGGAQPTTFLYWDGTTWSSSAGGNTNIDGDADEFNIGHAIYRMVGDIAVMGVIAGQLSAATLNASDVATKLSAWVSAGAIALWPMNQAVATDPVLDVTGNGADQISLTGVNQTISANPPDFDFSLAPPPVTVTGSGSITLGALTLSGTGQRTAIGSGTINLGRLAMSGTSITGGPIVMADDFYGPGPCRPYDYVSMCTLPLASAPITGYALEAASEIIYYASAQRFDTCQVTLRPCRAGCSGANWPALSNGWLEYGGGGPQPALINGLWYNIVCGACGSGCSCTIIDEVILPGPVREIVQVTVDGEVLVSDVDYRLDDYRKLVRLNNLLWPWCNDLSKGITATGTWSVTAIYGEPLPTLGKLAVGQLFCEIVNDILGSECELPSNLTELTRQGLSLTFETAEDALKSGFENLKYVDKFITRYNPHKLMARARVYDLDAPDSRVTGTTIT